MRVGMRVAIQSDHQIKQFIDIVNIVTPLNPREAFFGGTTNAIKLYHKVEETKRFITAT